MRVLGLSRNLYKNRICSDCSIDTYPPPLFQGRCVTRKVDPEKIKKSMLINVQGIGNLKCK